MRVSVYLSVCVGAYVCMSVCLPAWLSVCKSVSPSVDLYVYGYVYACCVCVFACVYAYVSVALSKFIPAKSTGSTMLQLCVGQLSECLRSIRFQSCTWTAEGLRHIWNYPSHASVPARLPTPVQLHSCMARRSRHAWYFNLTKARCSKSALHKPVTSRPITFLGAAVPSRSASTGCSPFGRTKSWLRCFVRISFLLFPGLIIQRCADILMATISELHLPKLIPDSDPNFCASCLKSGRSCYSGQLFQTEAAQTCPP